MGPRPKKRKLQNGASMSVAQSNADNDLPQVSAIPATDAEKSNWQGFCEIESEPAFFNVMLKEFGVQGVKVQEVLGLDEELLAILPKPVYGLIFLFRFMGEDSCQQEPTCPEHVWFANQTSEFSCATVAMLNIVNNVRGVDLGEHLQQFKDFTMNFTPALRGDQIGNFEFVKRIHNSFARKMDMLNIDLALKNAYDDRRKKRPKNSASTPLKKDQSSKSKSAKVITDEDYEEDSAFHFIAYVPIDGDVWKLDGLNRQPAKLGPVPDGQEWLSVVTTVLMERMADHEGGEIEFGLLSLVKDPIILLREQLAENIKTIQMTESQLDVVNPEWRAYVENQALLNENGSPSDVVFGSSTAYEISEVMVFEANVVESSLTQIRSTNSTELELFRQKLILAQRGVRAAIREEEMSSRADEERATDRRHDYGPLIYRWLTMLAENGVIPDLVEQTR